MLASSALQLMSAASLAALLINRPSKHEKKAEEAKDMTAAHLYNSIASASPAILSKQRARVAPSYASEVAT
jgi:hypothetical protein